MYGKTLLKLGMLKALNSDECSLPGERSLHPISVGMATPPLSESINPALPEETVMTSPEAVVMQDKAEFSQEPLPQHFFVSRSITRFKSQ